MRWFGITDSAIAPDAKALVFREGGILGSAEGALRNLSNALGVGVEGVFRVGLL
jgi:hypothetical protein